MKMLMLLVSITVVPVVGMENYNFEYDIKMDVIRNVSVPTLVVSDVLKSSSETVDYFKYFPIFKKIKYEYEYESTTFLGKKKIIVEFKTYSEKDSIATATVYYYNKRTVKIIDYNIKVDEKGIISRDIINGIDRIEIPIPLFKDKRWSDDKYENRVIGFSSTVKIGNKTYTNCLKILGNSKTETGKTERYYADGIGLIKEVIKTEDKTDILTLVNYK